LKASHELGNRLVEKKIEKETGIKT